MRIIIAITLILSLVACSAKSNYQTMRTSERQLKIDNEPYFIKGVCYNPVPVGQEERNFETLTQDIALMNEAGINTVRLYLPVDDKAIFDAMHQAGIKAIISFGYDHDGEFDMKSGTYVDYINKYKDHPAILLWEFGNEYNYHPEWFDGDLKNWYSILNETVLTSKRIDSTHLTATAHGELPDSLALAMCTDIDIWGMNVYRWDNPEDIFTEWEALSDKPMYLSEAGSDSYMTIRKKGYAKGENEKAQADATENILHDTFENSHICSGVAVFSFVDEWWKAGEIDTQSAGGWAPAGGGVPYDGVPNEEYWGIIKIDRTPKQVFNTIKAFYTNN